MAQERGTFKVDRVYLPFGQGFYEPIGKQDSLSNEALTAGQVPAAATLIIQNDLHTN